MGETERANIAAITRDHGHPGQKERVFCLMIRVSPFLITLLALLVVSPLAVGAWAVIMEMLGQTCRNEHYP